MIRRGWVLVAATLAAATASAWLAMQEEASEPSEAVMPGRRSVSSVDREQTPPSTGTSAPEEAPERSDASSVLGAPAASPAAPVVHPTREIPLVSEEIKSAARLAAAEYKSPEIPTDAGAASSIDETRGEWTAGLEAKYAGFDEAELTLARRTIEGILEWQANGPFEGAAEILPKEVIEELTRELGWLKR